VLSLYTGRGDFLGIEEQDFRLPLSAVYPLAS
jgi:hypothetical protein